MGKALSWARERGLSTELAWPQTQPAGRSEWEKPGQRGRQDTEKCPPSPSAAPEPKDLSTEVAKLFPVPETGEVAFPEEQGCSGSTLDFHCCFWSSSPSARAGSQLGRRGNKGKLPSMVPHLVFLPRILLPLTWYSWSLPTTANGIISCGKTKTRSLFPPEKPVRKPNW